MSPNEAPAAASCEGLIRVYRTASGEVHALRGIDAVIPAGGVTAIAGPSGSGKSSLLRILAALDRATAGTVMVGGADLGALTERRLRRLRRSMIGFVHQRPSHNLIPHLSAREHLVHAARMRGRRDDVDGLLDALGLGERASHRPHELSGGEQQRVAFAQAMIGGPALVVADEPTAELDAHSAALLLEQVRRLVRPLTAVMLSTHDEAAIRVADQVLRLNHGSVAGLSDRDHRGETLAVVDGAGRVQLPEEALALLPGGRVRVEVRGDGVWLKSPA